MFSFWSSSNPTKHHSIQIAGDSIHTTVTAEASSIESWISTIRSKHGRTRTIVGLDCEWKPNRFSWQTNKVATLQLCVANSCIIIQFFHLDRIPQALKSFLCDRNYTFVGIKVGEDIGKLTIDYGLQCSSWSDLGPLCKNYVGNQGTFNMKPQLGLKDCAWEVLGIRVEKPKNITLSNWELRDLSQEQAHYAYVDAYVSYKLGDKLILGN